MNYKAEIKAYGDADRLYKCFQPEIHKGERSNFKLKKEKDCLVFEIGAKDAVALRATMNSIAKLLNVYEKLGEKK